MWARGIAGVARHDFVIVTFGSPSLRGVITRAGRSRSARGRLHCVAMKPHCRLLPALGCLIVIGCAALKPSRDGNPATGSVEGRVVDAAGNGIPNATIAVLTPDIPPRELASGTSNYGGEFVVEKIPPGADRIVRATKVGRAVNTRATRQRVTIVGGKTLDLGTLELKAGGN